MNSRTKLILLAAFVVLLLVGTMIFDVRTTLDKSLQWIVSLGSWGPLIFILLYVAGCIFLVPGSLLTLGAGAIFGVIWGTVYCSIAATIGATAAFLVGRFFARDWVARKIETNSRFKAIDEAVATEGWKIVGLTRLSPLIPFTLLNYAFGITKVSLRDYFFASWIGMLPGTLLYVYIGSVIGDLGKLNQSGRARTPVEWALYGVGLVATVVVSVYLSRLARKALEQKIATP